VERGLQRFDELAQLANKMFTFGALAANFARYFVHDKRLYTVPSFVMECLVDNPTIPPMESWDNI
jgi:hypothetical protein